MISKALVGLENGLEYVRSHPNFILTLLLVVIIPVAFIWSASQFLSVSKDNQTRLEHDRIGLMHDMFLSFTQQVKGEEDILQEEITEIAALNPDIVAFRISERRREGYVPIAALNEEVLGTVEADDQIYNFARANPTESIVQTIEVSGERFIRGVRLIEAPGHELYLLTLTSREMTDRLFAQRERTAWIWMTILLGVVLLLTLRHIRLIDYSFLYKQATKAVKTRDLFTNMLAHELRAPLTAVRGYASMIEESSDATDETKKHASRIRESSERLLTIVNDLLDVARIQSGRLAVKMERANISKIVTAVLDELASTAHEKNIQLVHIGTDIDHIAIIDRNRMHQALINLVSNALKYTKQGSIEIELSDAPKHIELRVKDTGMGISAEDQRKLFAPFFRVESDDVNQITGTGLGMWITRQLLELMNASIGVESIKGVGTHIVVQLPKK